MKDGRLVAEGTTEELIRLVEGKVWSSRVPTEELPALERRLRIINLRNEEEGMVSIRYLGDMPLDGNGVREKERLEDLYLWLFPQNGREEA